MQCVHLLRDAIAAILEATKMAPSVSSMVDYRNRLGKRHWRRQKKQTKKRKYKEKQRVLFKIWLTYSTYLSTLM